jgi:hypothetical protein
MSQRANPIGKPSKRTESRIAFFPSLAIRRDLFDRNQRGGDVRYGFPPNFEGVAMFSLRALFLAVAVAALGFAALFAQNRYWTSAFVGVTLTIIIVATMVAIYRRTLAMGVFSGVAWLYMVVVLTSLFPLLHAYAPTTMLLIESWWATHKLTLVPPPARPSAYGTGYGSSGAPGVVRHPVVIPDEKAEVYKQALLNAYIDSDPKFSHYYASGQMLCTFIVALIASQCSAFFLRPKTPV